MDYYKFFKKINDRSIRYIVVGGLAVNLHGIPRLTYDIDLLVDMAEDNLKKLLAILKDWGYKPKTPVDILDLADPSKREDWVKNKNMKAFCMVSDEAPISEIDIILESPVNYETARSGITFYDLYDTKIATIGIDDLIKMKKGTGRKQDEMDVLHLKKLFG